LITQLWVNTEKLELQGFSLNIGNDPKNTNLTSITTFFKNGNFHDPSNINTFTTNLSSLILYESFIYEDGKICLFNTISRNSLVRKIKDTYSWNLNHVQCLSRSAADSEYFVELGSLTTSDKNKEIVAV
jgi:hypothetical protein